MHTVSREAVPVPAGNVLAIEFMSLHLLAPALELTHLANGLARFIEKFNHPTGFCASAVNTPLKSAIRAATLSSGR